MVPVAEKSDNYTFMLNFDQYLWVKDGGPVAGRKGLPPVGIGIFGRAGWAPKDRNVIDQFYSFGIAGYGMIIPGRDYDQWGIGWAGEAYLKRPASRCRTPGYRSRQLRACL